MTTRRRKVNPGNSREGQQYNLYSSNSATNYTDYTLSEDYYSSNSYSSLTTESDINMSCRDRTSEFMSTVKSMQTRQGSELSKPSALRQHSRFSQIAKKISKDIASTYAKLEKLTLLAKNKSLFDDKPVEIQELTYIIKEDVKSLNKQIGQLREFSLSERTRNSKHMQNHTSNVVVALQSKLAHMSNEFKGVLDMRTENMKQQKNRRDLFSDGHVQNSLPPSAYGPRGTSVLLTEASTTSNGAVAIDMNGVDGAQKQMVATDQQDEYLQDRADTMKSIESTIIELGSIFQQLAFMVKEQDEMVLRIDSNVEEASSNVEAAHSEILKYFQSISKNRWLMIKIFGVLIVFFIIFVVFMA